MLPRSRNIVYWVVAVSVGLLAVLSVPLCPSSDAAEPPQEQAPPPTAQAEQKPDAAVDESKAEDFKDEEPATPAEKMKSKELEKRACPSADLKYETKTDKSQHPTPEPSTGKALVYILRPTMFGNAIQTKLAVDAQWVGVNRGHNYFFLELEPGEHFFCSKAENRSVLGLTLEANKTYYLEQKVKMGLMKARNKLAMLKDEEGKKKLADCHLNTWQAKK